MIVITGGAGFIGSALVQALNDRGIKDIIIVDSLGSDSRWKNLVSLSYKDYLDKGEFLSLIINRKVPWSLSSILHMGACSSTTEKNADYLMTNNYKYTQSLCQYAAEKGVRFVYASSGATYGMGENGYDDAHEKLSTLRPLNMYGYSKHLFDLWALEHGLLDTIVGVKFFNVFGPNEAHKGDMRSMVLRAYEQIKATGKVRLFKSTTPQYPDGGQMRDFIYIKDCVEVVLWLLENKQVNGIFNLGSGKARSWNDLAEAVFKAMNLKSNIEYFDMPSDLTTQYQNFTEAKMNKLIDSGYPNSFRNLENSVSDYISFLA